MTEVRNLEDTRKEIDEIDARLLELFCRRMELAADVAAYKSRHGLPTLRPEREKEILDRAEEKAGYAEGMELAGKCHTILNEAVLSVQEIPVPGKEETSNG